MEKIYLKEGEITAKLKGKGISLYLKTENGEVLLKPYFQIGEDFSLISKTQKTAGAGIVYFSYDTLMFESDPQRREVIKQALDALKTDGVYVVFDYRNSKIYFLPEINKITFKEYAKPLKEKADLKAYETPSKTFEGVFKAINKTYIESYREKLLRELFIKEGKGEKIKRLNFKNPEKYDALINAKTFEELRNLAKEYSLKVLDKNLVVFDPQAGSGEGVLNAFERFGFNGILTGTEIRNLNVKNEKYKVITGVDFSLFKETIKKTFENASLKSAVYNTLFYLNPPYESDDYVLKESVEVLKDESLVIGLFPTKAEDFLKSRLSGYLLKIPRELTGYTDPKTPKRFILAIGVKRDKNDNLFSSEAVSVNVSTLGIDTPEKLSEYLFSLMSEKLPFKSRFGEMLEYFNFSEKRKELFYSRLQKNIDEFKEILQNEQKLQESLSNEKTLKDFKLSLSVLSKISSAKVFPDLRFYSPTGEYPLYSFKEVATNVSLLEFYKNNSPQIYNALLRLAKKNSISLPVSGKSKPAFDFDNPEKFYEDKHYVTNLNLGMLRFYFYPTSFELKTPSQKEKFLKTVKRALENKTDETTLNGVLNGVKKLLEISDKAVLKNSNVFIKSEFSIGQEDVFVLTDKFGEDLAKINVKVSDIFKALEEEGFFEIEKKVKIKKTDKEKKEKFIKSFEEYFDTFLNETLKEIKELEIKKGNSDKVYEIKDREDFLNKINAYFKKIDEKNLNKKNRILNYQKVLTLFGFEDYFESKFNLKDSFAALKKEIEKTKILDEELKTGLIELFEKYLKNIKSNKDFVLFYEVGKEKILSSLRETLSERGRLSTDAEILEFEIFTVTLNDILTKEYQLRKAISEATLKTARFLREIYIPLKNIEVADEKKFDLFIEKFFIDVFGLKPHQAKEALNFFALDSKTQEMLFWEMRAGKTRTMIAIAFMLGVYLKKDSNLILETANMPDIALQLFESFPYLLHNTNFIVGDKNKLSFLKSDNILETFPSEDIIVHLVKILKTSFKNKKNTADFLKKNFLRDFFKIRNSLNLYEVKKTFENTKYAPLIKFCENFS